MEWSESDRRGTLAEMTTSALFLPRTKRLTERREIGKLLQARDKTKELVAKAKATSCHNFRPRLDSDYLSAETIRRLPMGPSLIICSPLVICYLAKMTSLINGKNTLSNSSRRQAPPTESERVQTTHILTDELHPTMTPLKPAPIDEIRADLIKSGSRHGK